MQQMRCGSECVSIPPYFDVLLLLSLGLCFLSFSICRGIKSNCDDFMWHFMFHPFPVVTGNDNGMVKAFPEYGYPNP